MKLLLLLAFISLAFANYSTASAAFPRRDVPFDVKTFMPTNATNSTNTTTVYNGGKKILESSIMTSETAGWGGLWVTNQDDQDSSLPAITSVEATFTVPNITHFKALPNDGVSDLDNQLMIGVGCTIYGEVPFDDDCNNSFLNAHVKITYNESVPHLTGTETNFWWAPSMSEETTLPGQYPGWVEIGDEIMLQIQMLSSTEAIIKFANVQTGQFVSETMIMPNASNICSGKSAGIHAACGIDAPYQNWGWDNFPGYEALIIDPLNITDASGVRHVLDSTQETVEYYELLRNGTSLAAPRSLTTEVLEVVWPADPLYFGQ